LNTPKPNPKKVSVPARASFEKLRKNTNRTAELNLDKEELALHAEIFTAAARDLGR
jgi:hypothetical protein